MSTKKIASFESVLSASDSSNVMNDENKKLSCSTFEGKKKNAEKTFETLSNCKGYMIGLSNDVQEKNEEYERKGNFIFVHSIGKKFREIVKDKRIVICKGQEIFLMTEKFVIEEEFEIRILQEKQSVKNPNPELGFVPVKGKTEKHKFLFLNPLRFKNGIKIKLQ